jgi:hypothetical protein
MAAKDKFHDHVKNALVNDGWTVTDDPLTLPFGSSNLQIDLGAEKLIVATKGLSQIAVEVKSFLGQSSIADLQDALGQFLMYEFKLQKMQPERELWLALPEQAFRKLFTEEEVEEFRIKYHLKLIVFDPATEEILQWIR